jgi:hypothetical protein
MAMEPTGAVKLVLHVRSMAGIGLSSILVGTSLRWVGLPNRFTRSSSVAAIGVTGIVSDMSDTLAKAKQTAQDDHDERQADAVMGSAA